MVTARRRTADDDGVEDRVAMGSDAGAHAAV